MLLAEMLTLCSSRCNVSDILMCPMRGEVPLMKQTSGRPRCAALRCQYGYGGGVAGVVGIQHNDNINHAVS